MIFKENKFDPCLYEMQFYHSSITLTTHFSDGRNH